MRIEEVSEEYFEVGFQETIELENPHLQTQRDKFYQRYTVNWRNSLDKEDPLYKEPEEIWIGE